MWFCDYVTVDPYANISHRGQVIKAGMERGKKMKQNTAPNKMATSTLVCRYIQDF